LTKVNLLKETKQYLKLLGKSTSDIEWIGSMDGEFAISWKEFRKISDFEYNNKVYYGDTEEGWKSQVISIPRDLVVVGDMWYLKRMIIDNHETWRIFEIPTKREGKEFTKVNGVNQELKSLNMEICNNE
jgi:hypothetical protein